MEGLIARLKDFARRRDWEKFHNPKDLALSVSIEAAELLELFQWRNGDAPVDDAMREKLGGEMADVLLYLLLLADRTGVDLREAAHRKIDLNETRFPVSG